MTHLHLYWLALFPASTFLALVVGFGVFAGGFAFHPRLEEEGGVEVGLCIADYLCGGYGGWFVNCC
jgi:hypothetical protein